MHSEVLEDPKEARDCCCTQRIGVEKRPERGGKGRSLRFLRFLDGNWQELSLTRSGLDGISRDMTEMTDIDAPLGSRLHETVNF